MSRLRLGDLDLSVIDPHERDTAYIHDEIFVREIYHCAEFVLPEASTIIDVGANIGLYAIWAARRYRPSRVFAYEASPATFRYLQDNVSRLVPTGTEVRCIERAVSDIAGGLLELHQAPFVSGISTVLNEQDVPWVGELRRSGELVTHRVETTTLSEEIRRHGLAKVDLLKIDVEGHFMEVLGGIRADDFPKIANIVLEYEYLDALGLTERDIHEAMRGRGYSTREAEGTIYAWLAA